MTLTCVADANIFFSALLNPKGNNAQILTVYSDTICTCEYVFTELEKYSPLFARRNVDRRSYMDVLISGGLSVYPDEFVEEERVVLIDLMQAIDPKDILYVSLAKKLSLPLFTLDKGLLENELGIACVDTGGIAKYLH